MMAKRMTRAMQWPPKQELYRTAFFPLFDCHVSIVHAYHVSGEWLYYVHNAQHGIGYPEIVIDGNFIAAEHELTNFVL